jgi:hypothetical protein
MQGQLNYFLFKDYINACKAIGLGTKIRYLMSDR